MINYYDYQIKIVIVGDSGSGKTSLCKQLSERKFNNYIESTIGVDFISKIFEIKDSNKLIHYKAHIWDTAGQETYKSLIKSYYRGASGIILLFDLNNKNGFKNVQEWYNDIISYCPENSPIILVGNKCDIIQNVEMEKIDNFIYNKNIPFIITSAVNYKNTYNVFMYLIRRIHDKYMNEENVHVINKPGVFYIDSKISDKKKCCL